MGEAHSTWCSCLPFHYSPDISTVDKVIELMLNRHKWIIESMDLQWRWKRIKREGNGRGMKSIGRMDSILILLFFIIPSIAFPTTNLHVWIVTLFRTLSNSKMWYIFLSQKPNPEYRKIEGDIIVSDDDLIQVCHSAKGKFDLRINNKSPITDSW